MIETGGTMKVYDGLNEIEKSWYEMLKWGIEERQTSFSCEGLVSPEWINFILKAILVDNPQLFWFQGKWNLENRQGNSNMHLIYSHTEEEILRGTEELRQCVKEFRGTEERNPYEQARYLYDRLRESVSYGMSKSHGQTAYDALVRKEAVCKGLSKAYQLLLADAGIACTLAEGTIDGVAKHTWNVMQIGCERYNVDVALGYEEFSYLFTEERRFDKYRCFAVSDEIIRLTNRFTDKENRIL